MSIKEQLNLERIPKHIAIIMDGNGRWAKAKGLPRTAGHHEGVESVRAIAEETARLGVKNLTLYAFSTENWNRPTAEVSALMSLFIEALEEEIFMKNNIRFRVIGQRDRLPEDVMEHLLHSEARTAQNDRMTLTLALSYSSRWEITDTTQKIAREVAAGTLKPEEITEETITQHLNTSFMPDPDLLIRTGGELRMSNYLLWQCAYSELYFCNTYWPDFREEDLYKAILDFQQRERRFGKTSEQIAKQS
jgi:undecaprenyl diphosphate synthase